MGESSENCNEKDCNKLGSEQTVGFEFLLLRKICLAHKEGEVLMEKIIALSLIGLTLVAASFAFWARLVKVEDKKIQTKTKPKAIVILASIILMCIIIVPIIIAVLNY